MLNDNEMMGQDEVSPTRMAMGLRLNRAFLALKSYQDAEELVRLAEQMLARQGNPRSSH